MSSRNRVVFSKCALCISALSCLALLAACGSGTNHGTAPPTGGFNNSNLSGTYAFSVTGIDVNNAFIAIAGTFTANGSGGITGGTIEVNDNDSSVGQLPATPVTGGNYSVGADGRPESAGGLITLNTSSGSFSFDFVLSSNSGGLITYYETGSEVYAGSGSGTFALQTSVTQSSINGQTYSFNVSGESSTGSPFAIVGSLALDSNGSVGITTTGVEDINDGGAAACGGGGCTGLTGLINLSSVPGTAVVTYPGTATTFNFDVYPVSPSQLIFIETDTTFITAGNAFTGASSVPTGNNVFAVAGLDFSASDEPIAAVGLLVTNGSGSITNASTEDVNDAGTSTTNPVTGFTGTYSAVTTGRAIMTLDGFVNEGLLGCSGCTFAIYPFTSGGVSGMQILEIDDAGITGGVSYLQAGSPTFASGQGYGLNLTGSNLAAGAQEDDIAEFTNSSGTLTGLIDFNDQGTPSFGQSYSATYAADTSGIPGRGTVTPPSSGTVNAYGMATYVVDSSTSVAVVNDGSGMVALGTLQTQSATAAASASVNSVQQRLVALRASIVAGKHQKKQSKSR